MGPAFRCPFESLPEEIVGILIDQLAVHFREFHRLFRDGEHQRHFLWRNEAVIAGDDPIGRALEHADLGAGLGDFGNDLHRAGGRAHNADPLAFQFNRMVPFGRMHHRSVEAVLAGNVRPEGAVQLPQRADHSIRL